MLSPGYFQGFTVKKKVLPGSGSVSFTPTSSLPHESGSEVTGDTATIDVPDYCAVGFELSAYGDGTIARITTSGQNPSITHNASFGASSAGLTIQNTLNRFINVTVAGGVDDDVLFNGDIYEPGAYPFYGSLNGAHNFSYQTTLAPSASLVIQGKNYGGPGSISCTVAVQAV
jgi:hypothetical protein